jgi:hypothetical protein
MTYPTFSAEIIAYHSEENLKICGVQKFYFWNSASASKTCGLRNYKNLRKVHRSSSEFLDIPP